MRHWMARMLGRSEQQARRGRILEWHVADDGVFDRWLEGAAKEGEVWPDVDSTPANDSPTCTARLGFDADAQYGVLVDCELPAGHDGEHWGGDYYPGPGRFHWTDDTMGAFRGEWQQCDRCRWPASHQWRHPE